ncbi:MAG: epimerase, partial [Defluviitaleaceae bacterium]|nr:epimerase [Defluviitaleaceae bacterium]
IGADLLAPGAVDTLPDAENVIFMAGRKFGTEGNECLTWATNSLLPYLVSEKYKNSRIVVFSSGNIYPFRSPDEGGANERTAPNPVGEYAMSCLARERAFEYGSSRHGTRVCMYRLNYAVDLRYGVLRDIAAQIIEGRPISAATPFFNCIWQGDANEAALRCLALCESPPGVLNVTGPETVSVRRAAALLGERLNIEPIFECGPDMRSERTALLSDAAKMHSLFGYPRVSLLTMIRWQVEWIMGGGSSLGIPTHFEERGGVF